MKKLELTSYDFWKLAEPPYCEDIEEGVFKLDFTIEGGKEQVKKFKKSMEDLAILMDLDLSL